MIVAGMSDQTAISPGEVKPVAFSRPSLHALLVIGTAIAFADSSIVVLAVPEIVQDFDVGVNSASWVVTAYNLAVVVAGVALLRLVRSFSPSTLAGTGLIVFGAASAGCAVAPSLAVLAILRGVQGLGAAALLVAALPLLERPGSRLRPWLLAATIGTAAGPALGGLLTEFFSWRSIFVVQAPFLVLGVVALAGAGASVPAPTVERLLPGRRTGFALAALAALSASLVGALFLVIVLLVAGLGWDPLPASLVATTLPVLALVADRFTRRTPEVAAATAGCVLVAGGLATLGLLAEPTTVLIVAGLALCGIGLGLASHPLGERALGRSPSLAAGTRTVVARHVGLVAALLIVTPLLVHSFGGLRSDAEEVVGKTVLEAPLPLQTKLPLMIDLGRGASAAKASPPDVDAIFASHGGESDPALRELKSRLDNQMDELVVRTFRPALLVCALFALLAAAAALGLGQAGVELRRRRTQAMLAAATVVGASLIVVDLGLGALDDPVAAVDPCTSDIELTGGGLDIAVQRGALSALDDAACRTGTSRVELLRRTLAGDSAALPSLPGLPPLSDLLPPGGPPTPP
jgi:predicted MFS family arabinose efflux permease